MTTTTSKPAPGNTFQPAFGQRLHVGRPNIGDNARFLARVQDMLDRRVLTNDGPYVQEFEAKLATMLGVRHAVLMCNATVALEIAIRALGLTGEVIVPSFTFIATAHALQWQEITPVFCDVRPGSHHIDPDRVRELITPRTTGIIGVHLWGEPCDVDGLTAVANRYGLRLLFDAAHAFACTSNGRMIGSFGDGEVFSFHATKFLNTLEGGAVTTNNDEFAAKMRLMRNFGFAGYDKVIYIGTNGKMNEVSAAMGLTNLESIGDFINSNRRNYLLYREQLADLPGVRLWQYLDGDDRNYQYVVLEIDDTAFGISRDALMHLLWANNVLARRYFFPGCHRMEPYRSFFPHAHFLLPETERLAGRVLQLPTGTGVSMQDITVICSLIRRASNTGIATTS